MLYGIDCTNALRKCLSSRRERTGFRLLLQMAACRGILEIFAEYIWFLRTKHTFVIP